ncbi:MAG: DNA-directed RNA polymerase subunit alpha, partial [Acidimicrobiaceae bacterium]
PENNRQKFSVGPLEPGLGHTIGNSLRRMLLSSIPGAAITSVKFESALHEFDTIEGVTQDVTEIILNLKDIVLQSTSNDPVVLSVDVKGPMELTAGDIQCPPEVEILNKSQKIATLSAKGKLVFELTVEQGKGYMSSDRDGARKTIGIIPIDAIFSPIRRVTFEVVPTRVEQSTNYDNLILDIETDGSIAPVDALASAGATLRSLVDLVANLTAEPVALELGEVSGYSSGNGDLDLPIEDLDLSERPRNCLKRGQVNTIGELLTRSEEDLMNITNFGQKSLDE